MSQSPRVLILGATAQLGIELQRSFAGSAPLAVLGRDALDLRLRQIFSRSWSQPGWIWILNATVYTAVDRAESDKERAFAAKVRRPRMLAEESSHANALLVHYSTNYVFDGCNMSPGRKTIRRILAPAGSTVRRETISFFTMLRLGRECPELNLVDDQVGAPTTASELARATLTIADGALEGRYRSPAEWTVTSPAGHTPLSGFPLSVFVSAGLKRYLCFARRMAEALLGYRGSLRRRMSVQRCRQASIVSDLFLPCPVESCAMPTSTADCLLVLRAYMWSDAIFDASGGKSPEGSGTVKAFFLARC